MLDILYAEKLCIHDWPAGVPPPGPDFDLKALSASQLHALVVPYLRHHLGVMYEADLGQEDEDDDTEAEAAKMKKCKSKSKKSNDTRSTSVTPKKGPLRLIVLYTCINPRGMIFMGFPSYFGTKTAAGTTIGKYFMGQT
jgi:hypothetical protein